METSNSTLSMVVNTVLENIGERRQLNLSSPVSRKCIRALTDALTDIASLDDWEFSRATILAETWNNDVADLGNVLRVHSVSYGDASAGFVSIPWIDEVHYNSLPVTYHSTNQRARVFTIAGYNKVRLNPYPITFDEKSKYRFKVTQSLSMPILDDDTFPIPERLMSLLVYKACSLMSISHLDDQQAAAIWDRQFSNLLLQTRARESNLPIGGINTFKLRSRRTRW